MGKLGERLRGNAAHVSMLSSEALDLKLDIGIVSAVDPVFGALR